MQDADPKPAPESAVDELGRWRGKLLDLTGGDVERINAFLAKAIKSQPRFDDLNVEQLQTVYEILETKIKKRSESNE